MTPNILDDLDLYSDLLSSIGTHTNNRPLTPIECSDLIVQLQDETNESWEALSKRLGLGKKRTIATSKKPVDTTQIKQFVKLQQLSRKNVYALGWGVSKDGKIGFSIGYEVTDLPNKDDYDIILNTVLNSQETENPIIKKDVMNIVDRKIKSPEIPIEEIIEHVINIKPKLEHRYKIGIAPFTNLLEKLEQIISEKQITSKELLQKLIQRKFKNNEISSVYFSKNNLLWFTLEKEKFDELEKEWKSKKTSVTSFFNEILLEAIKNE